MRIKTPWGKGTLCFFWFLTMATAWLGQYYYIEVGGAQLRIPYILGLILCAIQFRQVARLSMTGLSFKLIWIWCLLLFVSAAWSVSPIDTIKASALPMLLVLWGLSITSVVAYKTGYNRLTAVIKFLAITNVIIAMVQFITIRVIDKVVFAPAESQSLMLMQFSRPSSLFTEPDVLGHYMMWAFLFLFPGLMGARRWYSAALLPLCILIVLILSQTRAAWLGTLAGIAVYFLLYGSKGLHKCPRLFYISGISLLILAIVTLSTGTLDCIVGRMAGFFDPQTSVGSYGSGELRLAMMEFMWQHITVDVRTFLLGNGWGTLSYFIVPLADPHVWPEGHFIGWGNYGPNILLTVLFNVGAIGLMFFLSILILIAAKALRCLKYWCNREQRLVIEGLVLTLAGMLAAGQVTGELYLPTFWLTLCLISTMPLLKDGKNVAHTYAVPGHALQCPRW